MRIADGDNLRACIFFFFLLRTRYFGYNNDFFVLIFVLPRGSSIHSSLSLVSILRLSSSFHQLRERRKNGGVKYRVKRRDTKEEKWEGDEEEEISFTVIKDERRDEGEPCDYYNFTVINSFFVYFSLL